MTAATRNQEFGEFNAKLFSILTFEPLAWAMIGVPLAFLSLYGLSRPGEDQGVIGFLISILGYMFWVGLLFFFQIYVSRKQFSCHNCGEVSQYGEILSEVVYNNSACTDGDDYSNTTTGQCPHCKGSLYQYQGGVLLRI